MTQDDLELKIKDLSGLVESYQSQIGQLNSQVENLYAERKQLKQRLEKANKDLRNEQRQKEILEADNRRLGDELQLAQSHQTVSAIIQSIITDFQNTRKKVFAKINNLRRRR